MKSFSTTRCSGFTLVEAAVATLVVGVAVVAAFEAMNAAMAADRRARDLDRAVLLAESRVSDLLARPVREMGIRRGAYSGGDAKFRWETTIRPTDHERLAEVRVRILWRFRGRERSYQLLTLRQLEPMGEG